jgi:hypothetical protein
MYAVCAARRGERLGSFGAEHAEPDNMHTLAAVIEAPTQRAESAICAASRRGSAKVAFGFRDRGHA